jgi:hypothetical protein
MAIKLEAANLVITTDGGFTPTTLPKHGFAPIRLHGYGNIATKDGSLPPVLETVTLWFDKHGEVETQGLPTCSPGKLAATTTAQARKLCPGAIVGKGFGTAVVAFPDQPPIKASSAITLFNARPKHGNPVVLAHAHLTVPGPTTFVVPIEIQKVHAGRYGFKTVAKIPKIAGGSGIPARRRAGGGRLRHRLRGHGRNRPGLRQRHRDDEAAGAAEARQRADHPHQHRPGGDSRRLDAADAEDAALPRRQARDRRHQGPADLHDDEARRDHPLTGAQALRRRPRRQGARESGGDDAWRRPVHDQLPPLLLQRPSRRR